MFIKVNIKQLLFFLPLIIFFYPSSSNVYAESYTTGDSNTSISVETNTSGGTTETHISIEANGEKNVIDSNKNGKIEIKTNSSSQAKNAITTPSITGVQKKTTATHSTKKLKKEKKNDIEHLLLNIENMLKSFFK